MDFLATNRPPRIEEILRPAGGPRPVPRSTGSQMPPTPRSPSYPIPRSLDVARNFSERWEHGPIKPLNLRQHAETFCGHPRISGSEGDLALLRYAIVDTLRSRRRTFSSIPGVLLSISFVAGTFIAIDSSPRATLEGRR